MFFFFIGFNDAARKKKTGMEFFCKTEYFKYMFVVVVVVVSDYLSGYCLFVFLF